jgi:quercetin dioxygenase-like cupin family protein
MGSSRPHRFVTAPTAQGTPYLARYEKVEEVEYDIAYPGLRAPGKPELVDYYRIWAWDRHPLEPHTPQASAEALRRSSAVPASPEGGRVTIVSFRSLAPSSTPAPGALHWNDTLVVQLMFAGRLGVVLDDTSSITLTSGDVVVHTGTNHAWRPHPQGAAFVAVVLGARRVGREPASEHRGLSSEKTTTAAVADALALGAGHGRPRRIVTGLRDDGRSCFAMVEECELAPSTHMGVTECGIWSSERVPVELPADAGVAGEHLSDPLRVTMLEFTPRAQTPPEAHELAVHALLNGTLTIAIDDGTAATMRPGDVLIQLGPGHAWTAGEAGARVGTVVLGAASAAA